MYKSNDCDQNPTIYSKPLKLAKAKKYKMSKPLGHLVLGVMYDKHKSFDSTQAF